MDTRFKILDEQQALEVANREPVSIVTGWFDPLLASHARRLAEIRAASTGRLMAVVTEPEKPVLTSRARAELVAGLRVIDYVVVSDGGCAEPFLAAVRALAVFREEQGDARRQQEFIEHVYRRQAG
jgi:bifunctional ADP-heptose synthase (sugar kinase/adenylyltransferase)